MIARRLVALAAMLALASPASAQFGQLGRVVRGAQKVEKLSKALKDIGEEEEIKLGSDLAGMLMGAAPLIEDPAKQAYVNRVGRWLASHSERANLPWQFGIIDTDSVNAFSTPGGYVLITRGLFDQLRNESELADVLAHEIAHVVKRHHLRALQKDLGDALFGEVTGHIRFNAPGPGGAVANKITSRLVNAGRELFIRGLDKADEYEADRMGAVIAARSGYSPYGMIGVLQTLSGMQATSGLIGKTHPEPVDRIERLGSAMGTRLDAISGLVDDLPGFVALMTPPPAPAATPKAAPRTTPRTRPKGRP